MPDTNMSTQSASLVDELEQIKRTVPSEAWLMRAELDECRAEFEQAAESARGRFWRPEAKLANVIENYRPKVESLRHVATAVTRLMDELAQIRRPLAAIADSELTVHANHNIRQCHAELLRMEQELRTGVVDRAKSAKTSESAEQYSAQLARVRRVTDALDQIHRTLTGIAPWIDDEDPDQPQPIDAWLVELYSELSELDHHASAALAQCVSRSFSALHSQAPDHAARVAHLEFSPSASPARQDPDPSPPEPVDSPTSSITWNPTPPGSHAHRQDNERVSLHQPLGAIDDDLRAPEGQRTIYYEHRTTPPPSEPAPQPHTAETRTSTAPGIPSPPQPRADSSASEIPAEHDDDHHHSSPDWDGLIEVETLIPDGLSWAKTVEKFSGQIPSQSPAPPSADVFRKLQRRLDTIRRQPEEGGETLDEFVQDARTQLERVVDAASQQREGQLERLRAAIEVYRRVLDEQVYEVWTAVSDLAKKAVTSPMAHESWMKAFTAAQHRFTGLARNRGSELDQALARSRDEFLDQLETYNATPMLAGTRQAFRDLGREIAAELNVADHTSVDRLIDGLRAEAGIRERLRQLRTRADGELAEPKQRHEQLRNREQALRKLIEHHKFAHLSLSTIVGELDDPGADGSLDAVNSALETQSAELDQLERQFVVDCVEQASEALREAKNLAQKLTDYGRDTSVDLEVPGAEEPARDASAHLLLIEERRAEIRRSAQSALLKFTEELDDLDTRLAAKLNDIKAVDQHTKGQQLVRAIATLRTADPGEDALGFFEETGELRNNCLNYLNELERGERQVRAQREALKRDLVHIRSMPLGPQLPALLVERLSALVEGLPDDPKHCLEYRSQLQYCSVIAERLKNHAARLQAQEVEAAIERLRPLRIPQALQVEGGEHSMAARVTAVLQEYADLPPQKQLPVSFVRRILELDEEAVAFE